MTARRNRRTKVIYKTRKKLKKTLERQKKIVNVLEKQRLEKKEELKNKRRF